ncbi:MAG: ABC transporter ATP-binding protein [Candidatus Thermoplasmatota archaeon]|nr:ABC transporter ATP-binding protein [Candidatus Thermoplasmatota archaeon]
MEDEKTLLYVSNLTKFFQISGGIGRRKGYVRALDSVTFSLKEGETLGVVGETGCGKTTLGRSILQLIKPTSGDVFIDLPEDIMKEVMEIDRRLSLFDEEDKDSDEYGDLRARFDEIAKEYSLTRMHSHKLKEYRKMMQPVFQDPFSSLDPRKLIKDSVAEPMKLLTDMNQTEIQDKEISLISEIGLSEDHLYRFPHEFSGGQRQRIGIARAISIEPKLLVLDEPTSALDVSVQAQILNILKELQNSRGISYVFISHHLSVIRMMADRVAVMYLGKLVELAETEELFTDMLHPYTKALLSAIPIPDPSIKRERIILEGEIPSPADPPKGCYFHPRCPVAMKNCGWSPRDLINPIKEMLDPYRNQEASSLPEIIEIVSDEEENVIELVFKEGQEYDKESVREQIRQMILKESSKKGGVKYSAVESVEFSEEGTVLITLLDYDTPTLKEARKGHFVSCLLYDYNYYDENRKVNEDAGKQAKTKINF